MNDKQLTIDGKYEVVIGLEVHIELSTKSKMFCRCSADYFGAEPNSHTCPICLGLPGAMPKANKLAIEFAQKLAVSLNCQIQLGSKFDRKNYFYPDLAKGYQISQYDLPFSKKGYIEIFVTTKNPKKESARKIGITRVHLEEDTGKLSHAAINGRRVTLIDFNRSGVPLMEVVSEPDMRSAIEAKAYAQKLQQIVRYLEISDADMEKGSMRIEPNISLRKIGDKTLPEYKVELKNINSFKFAEKAINFEIERQSKILTSGQIPVQETRGWDEKGSRTVTQRSKEFAHDYRYFPEPDLPPFDFSSSYIQKLQTSLPELPDAKRDRLIKQYKLLETEADLLSQDKDLSIFFEHTVKAYKGNPKKVINWITGELLRRLNELGKTIGQIDLLPAQIAELLYLVDKDKITSATAKELLEKMIQTGKSAGELISELNLTSISKEQLKGVIEKIIKANLRAATDFKNGKKESLEFLIGQVQKEVKGRADPTSVRALLLKDLEG